jgi:hypothetical protein
MYKLAKTGGEVRPNGFDPEKLKTGVWESHSYLAQIDEENKRNFDKINLKGDSV